MGVGSPLTMHILGIELRLSDLAARDFSCSATSLALAVRSKRLPKWSLISPTCIMAFQ